MQMCLCCLLLNIYATFESTYKFYIEKNILVHHQILIVLPRAPNGPKKCGCRRDFSRLSETSRPRSKEFIVCSRLRDHKISGCKCTHCTHYIGALAYVGSTVYMIHKIHKHRKIQIHTWSLCFQNQ